MGLVLDKPRAFFENRVDTAFKRLGFRPRALSRQYLVELLESFMFSGKVFEKGETLAELYLRAMSAPGPQRLQMLKKLGDGSLYISGFFGDSLTNKMVDIDYYVDMGGTAYGTLAVASGDGDLAVVYDEYARNFGAFVDVLTFISQESLIQSNGDLLRLYDRFVTTGSRLAEEQLAEKGLLNADLPKAKANKM